MMTLELAVVDLLEQLERISHEHEELTDTDVREALHLALNYYFVWGQARERTRFPCNFGMFSQAGDLLVAEAIWKFLDTVEQSEEISKIPVGQARLDILQSSSAKSASGVLYDELIGHRVSPLVVKPLP